MKLSKKEQGVAEDFVNSLRVPKRKTKKQVVMGMLGLVGSGKSTVAKVLAKEIGAVVVGADAIKVALREKGVGYDRSRYIEKLVYEHAIKAGSNVVLDTDYVNKTKRDILVKETKGDKVSIKYLRVICERDTMIGRILFHKQHRLFSGASSDWAGKNKAAVVKMREMWRRTPHHYKWEDKGTGGKWLLRKLPFKVFAEVDTTDEAAWKKQIKQIVGKIAKL